MADDLTYREVRADEVQPGDRLWGAYLAGGSGVVTSATTSTTYPHATTIGWRTTRWVDDQGRQVPAFEGEVGQCFCPRATVRLVVQ